MGRFVGFAESVGDALTYKVLTNDTQKIIYCSYVRSALNDTDRNKCLDPTEKEPKPIIEVVKTTSGLTPGVLGRQSLPNKFVHNPYDLVGSDKE